jgi:hypothetical protein
MAKWRKGVAVTLSIMFVLAGLVVVTAPLLSGHSFLPKSPTGVRAFNAPLQVTLTVNPNQATVESSVQFQANAQGGTMPWTFTYTGLPPGCSTQNSSSFTCNPSSAGDYSVAVMVSDERGNTSTSNSVSLDITSSSNGNGNGNGGNNSSNPFSSLLSGFSGILSLLIIAGIVGFVTWILLIVGVWIIAIVLMRRLPKRGEWSGAAAASPMMKCASCSSDIPAGSKFCPNCGTSTTPKSP